MITQYAYSPLSNPETEIRIALLQPGADDDPICIEFQARNLSEVEPKYEALSYAWGPKENPSVVHVRREAVESIDITRNLDEALHHLRYENKPRPLWIDALCINQGSVQERNKQVTIMSQIYAKAACVVIWIGPEKDKSREALYVLQHLGRQVDFNWNTKAFSPSKECDASDEHFSDMSVPLPYRKEGLTPILDLFNRPYFKRVWIRQEIALATRAILHCGHSRIEWQDFRNAIACLNFKLCRVGSIPWARFTQYRNLCDLLGKICAGSAGTCSYSTLQDYMSNTVCEDPRDRIFAMTAMMRKSDRDLDIRPDYHKTTEEVYITVAERVIFQHQSLELLQSCDLASRALRIPSWVPDWSSPRQMFNLDASWSACAWISSGVSMLGQGQLKVVGLPVTHVEAIIEPEKDYHDSGTYKNAIELLNRTLRKLAPCADCLEAQSLNEHRWTEIFCQATLHYYHAESFLPLGVSKLPFKEYVEFVKAICFPGAIGESIIQKNGTQDKRIRSHIWEMCRNKTFFTCSDGRIGVACTGVKENDLVSVLFNERYPVLLRSRPDGNTDAPGRWEVVSTAVVGDLMNGEAIYGFGALSHQRPVEFSGEQYEDSDLIDGWNIGMYDSRSKMLSTDPAIILSEAGIKVERYQREPHRLEVLPETLRAAGLRVQDFILV